jgi:hypothetical protein
MLFRDFSVLALNVNPVDRSSTGYKHTDAAKALIASSRSGKPVSPKTRRLLSLIFTGPGNPFAGKKHSAAMLALFSAL